MANIYESTIEERELLDNKLVEFNRKKVPFLQSEDWSVLSYALKDETGQAIAGINSMLYCWNILYVDILYPTFRTSTFTTHTSHEDSTV